MNRTESRSMVTTQVAGLIQRMRLKQWIKNGFIFVPLVFDGKVIQPRPLLATLAGFALSCMITSAVYLINDLVDLEADRAHPTKRYRPLPSGQIGRAHV